MAVTNLVFNQGHENFQEQMNSLFNSKVYFTKFFGFKTIMTAAQAYYPRDEWGGQVIYIPNGAACLMRITNVISSPAGSINIVNSATVAVNRDDGGITINGATSAVTIGAGQSITGETAGGITAQIARNTTVNGVELLVTKATNTSTSPVSCTFMVEILNNPPFVDSNVNLLRAPGTSAATVAEPVA